jgi:hypothetical protein
VFGSIEVHTTGVACGSLPCAVLFDSSCPHHCRIVAAIADVALELLMAMDSQRRTFQRIEIAAAGLLLMFQPC